MLPGLSSPGASLYALHRAVSPAAAVLEGGSGTAASAIQPGDAVPACGYYGLRRVWGLSVPPS